MSGSAAWPFLTSGLRGCGGILRQAPEDFEVEELPAYPPGGEGEHLFLWVEKRGLSTPELAAALARALELPVREVSSAGLKDKHAVTRQLLSVPARVEPRLAGFSHPLARVLWAKRHRNKLRTGHLRGNAFRLRIREVQDAAAGEAVLAVLMERGVPNYFGEQRFGAAQQNAALGRKLLAGERLPGRVDRFQRRLYLSALQSLLFNRLLAVRVTEGSLTRALPGDVMKKVDTGGLFVCAEPQVDQPRVDRFEISPAGPMFGPEALRASGEVALREEALLAEEGLTWAAFAAGGDETRGTRRAYRVQVTNAQAGRDGADLLVSFELPSGSYATVVLAELMKSPGAEARMHGQDNDGRSS